MGERRTIHRGRTLLGGKIVFNGGRSAIDCRVRNLSDDGACLEVESQAGIPLRFQLQATGDHAPRDCKVAWQSEHRLGVSFERRDTLPDEDDEALADTPSSEAERTSDFMRGHVLALRAALDEVRFGVVLLDHEMRAQFINRAFRKMFRLPDHKADAKPPFVALMYHGRDTRAYEIPADELDAYVAERVEHVKRGDPVPRDLRLASGEVLRLQCAVLPDGGRMLSYTYVTDIVHHVDELDVLRAALDKEDDGIVLLDAGFNVSFINATARRLFTITEEQAAGKPPFSMLVLNARKFSMFDIPADKLDGFLSMRVAQIRAGDPTPHDLHTRDGRHIRVRCTALPGGGRMLTYRDVSDLIRDAEKPVPAAE